MGQLSPTRGLVPVCGTASIDMFVLVAVGLRPTLIFIEKRIQRSFSFIVPPQVIAGQKFFKLGYRQTEETFKTAVTIQAKLLQ